MDKFTDLLQQKELKDVVKDLITFAKKNNYDFKLEICQFFIDFLSKKYDISEEDFDEFDETNDGYANLAEEVEMSENIAETTEISYSDFIQRFLDELFILDMMKHSSLTCWIEFLSAIIEHNGIQEDATSKAKAHTLLAYMLPSIAKLLHVAENSDLLISNDLKASAQKGLERIMENVEKSFDFDVYGGECSKHVGLAFKTHHEIFIHDVNGLKIFHKMLSKDSRPMLYSALITLKDICEIESLNEICTEFFFTSTEGDDENVIDKVFKLLNHKNLKMEVIQLLTSLSVMTDRCILDEDKRYEVFINVFSKNKKVATQTSKLIIGMELDLWLEIIIMLNYYLSPEEIDIPYILTTFEVNPKTLLDLTCNNINDPITSQRTAQLFIQSLKITNSQDDIIDFLKDSLETCQADPKTFCILLQAITTIECDKLVEFFKEKTDDLAVIVETIATVFQASSHEATLKSCVSAWFLLHSFSKDFVALVVFEMTKINVTAYLQNPDDIGTIKRLTELFDIHYWSIMGKNTLIEFYNEIRKFQVVPQLEKKNFLILRLFTSVLKHVWMALRKGLISADIISLIHEDVESYAHQLKIMFKDINSDRFNFQGRCCILTSLMEVMLMFQPAMKKMSDGKIFKIFSFNIEKTEAIELVESIEQLVFYSVESTGEENDFYRKLLIQTYSTLYVNHKNLPSLTSWEVLLRFYSADTIYKAEIEQLMTHAFDLPKGIFDKTVAFAILNISNWNKTEHFRNFFNAFDPFLKTLETDSAKRQLRYAMICTFAFEKLQIHVKNIKNVEDRLLVLDFFAIILKNVENRYRKSLVDFINLDALKLNANEKQKVESFKEKLND